MSLAVVGISVPMFVVGPILQLVFAMKLGWLPGGGLDHRQERHPRPHHAGASPSPSPPSPTSRAFPVPRILEVLRSDYVRTARAKGLKESVVVSKHVLKGALLPVVSFIGPAFAGIITGSLVVESTFAVPGIGRIFVQSALNRDYTLIMAEVIIFSLILVVMNFLVDIVYGFLDPRIAYK